MLFNNLKEQKDYKKNLYVFKKLTLTFLTPIPIDGRAGLILDVSHISIEFVGKSAVNYKVGLNGEVLISENLNSVCVLTLKYLPNAPSVAALDLLKKAKTQFGIFINNSSSPSYKGMASECRILEKPSVDIGTNGFDNISYKILMTDYLDIYPTSKIDIKF